MEGQKFGDAEATQCDLSRSGTPETATRLLSDFLGQPGRGFPPAPFSSQFVSEALRRPSEFF